MTGFKRLLTAGAAVVAITTAASACTSAIVSADANPYGRPILWKHRDTSTTDNKVEYVAPSHAGMGYVALFNASDAKLKEAWMGMNEAGFAVMNTASYNIKEDKIPDKKMDKEGILMTRALLTCRTVDDFARLLDNYPRPMGVEANFGVIDAYGNGAYFETNNTRYVRYDLADAEGGVMVRTNYSHSGRQGEGYGHVREKNAELLLAPYVDEKSVTPEVLTEVLSRQFYHTGQMTDNYMCGLGELPDIDYIPRYKSTATIAIEGCVPQNTREDAGCEISCDDYVMWTAIGYPPVAEIRAVRCAPDGVPDDLRGTRADGHSKSGDAAKAIRDSIFTTGAKPDVRNLDAGALYNRNGDGLAQMARHRNCLTYARERQHNN